MIADLSVSKQQTNVVPNGEDFDVTFVVTVENTGSTRMDNLTLFDDIAGQFGDAFQSVSNPILDPTGIVGGIAPILNPAWPANPAADLLWPAVINEFLLPGDSFTITYTVTIDPDVSGTSGYLNNQATVAGEDITTIPTSPLAATDDSDSGADPASNNIDEPGDTGGNNDPTPVFIADLGVAKQQTGTPSQLADGTWNIDFELFVENTGTVDLASPTLFDDVQSQLSTAWQGSSNLAIDTSGVSLGGIAPGLNPLWLADPTQNLFDGTGILRPGEHVRVTFTLNIDPDNFVSGLSQPLFNQAIGGGTATDSNGNTITDASQNPIVATDRSDSGADANTDNSGAPGDSGATDDPTPLILPEIGAAKQIIATAAATTPGNTNVTYEIVLRNIGTVDLVNLTLTEDIQSTIGGAFVGIVGSPVIASSTASTNPSFNAAWDGNLDGVGNANLFDGTSGLLAPGEQIVVRFTAEIDVDQLTTTSHNQVVVSGQYDPTPGTPGDETIVSDLSDTDSDTSNNNIGVTGDSAGEDDATLIPALGVAKEHGDPIAVGENFLLPVTLILENLGSTDLANLSLIDNLQSQLGAAFVGVSNLTIDDSFVVGGTSPNINPSWTGNGANILNGGLLAPGDSVIVTFDVLINPDTGGTSRSLSNAAVASATDPSQPGIVVSDVSDRGNDPSGGEDATPINIPDAGVAKQVTNLRQVGAQFELTIEIVLENTGTVNLTNLLLADDLAAQFGSHFDSIIGAPAITASTASVNPNLNAGYLGDTTQNLFDSTSGLLEPGQAIVVELRVLVDAAGDGSTTLVNQATGGGVPLDSNGNPITDASGAPIGLVTDDSDSGSDPNGNNPDEPGDTGGFDDPTETQLRFFTFDALNNFAKGFGPDEPTAAPANRLLSKSIPSLAPEPVFSGTARPGTQIIGRVFDGNGHLVGESISIADVGGNWMMQMHNARNVENARVEFTEIVGSIQTFAPNGDIYGYLGVDQQSNHYASLEPWTGFDQAYDFNAVLSGTARQKLARMHQQNNATIGLASS